jgi:trehalose 6-phosphate synthase/phosphatase
LTEATKLQDKRKIELLKTDTRLNLIKNYRTAKRRLLLLDYDGTLMNFQADPKMVTPDPELLSLLTKLNKDRKNKIVIVSGRDYTTMEKWFSKTKADMSAEHGVWKKRNGRWQAAKGLSIDWKKQVEGILEKLVERTPKSFIEEKHYSLVWHYRKVDKELGEKRVREFHDLLLYFAANLDLQVLEGNKVIEVKTADWLNEKDWDFVLIMGDDQTDEDMFKVARENDYTIKIGLTKSAAKYHLLTVSDARNFLWQLAGHQSR